MMLQDRAGLGSEAVVRAANDLVAAANVVSMLSCPSHNAMTAMSTPD
jgi:hypothetical protein